MATNQGLKGVCIDASSRVGKTKPFGLKGVIFPEAGAAGARMTEVCGNPYRRKGISSLGLQFMPALAEEEEAAGKSTRKSANADKVGPGGPTPADDEEEINPF